MNLYMERGGYTVRHSRFIHARTLLRQRLFHEYLGYNLDGIPLDVKTGSGLISESSEFIPYEDLPRFWVFQRLALLHRYENRKLAPVCRKKRLVLVAKCIQPWLKAVNSFLKSLFVVCRIQSLCHHTVCSLDSEITPYSFLSFPVTNILPSCAKQTTQ